MARDNDDWIAERWPDDAHRAERRAKLFERLNTFLDAFVETRGSGWAAATREDVSEMADIWQEIADLKFERDCDGDSVINFDVANRQHGRLVSTFVPYAPRDGRGGVEEPVQTIDEIDFVKQSVRAARFLISSGESIFNSMDYHLDDIAKAVVVTERLADAEPRVTALLTKGRPSEPDADGQVAVYTTLSWKEALDEVETFTRAFPEATEATDRVKAAYLEVYGDTPEFVAANAEIIDMVSTGRLDEAKDVLLAHRKVYGVGVRPGIDAYNEAHRVAAAKRLEESRARRAAEKAAESAS